MNYLLNKKILLLIPITFFIIIVFRITYAYFDVKNTEYQFAYEEAKILNSYSDASTKYHQNLFFNKTIKLDAKTIAAFPAYSSRPISENFTKKNKFNISMKTVSDRARNKKNQANKHELQAINYFKKNKDKKTYFQLKNDTFYHYASAIKIEKKCLQCHSKKSDAPQFIQDKYEDAYDYNIGDVRAILSIEIPVVNLDNYFMSYFYKSVIYDIILFLILFLSTYYVARNNKRINNILQHEVKEKTDELKSQLVHDRLTKYPNRIQLFWDIEERETNLPIHLALLNIDRFRDINDFYGHDEADSILKTISDVLDKKSKTFNASFYKLPSDEFAILLNKQITKEEFYKLVKELIEDIHKREFNVQETSIYINFSCGCASNEDEVIAKADMALQHAKVNNNKTVVMYDKALDTSEMITSNIDGIKLLKNAIENDKIRPSFQPIYNVSTKKISKYESLARIATDDGKVISPFQFIDIAKKSNLYPYITKSMIKKSFAFFKDKEYEFSINLSIDDIENKETVKYIISKINDFPEPSRIIFEILESEEIEDYENLRLFIQKIKYYGCKFAIDDFGSGYSNFSHIFELNVDYLKIDSSLVKNITTDENSRIITKTIIEFAKSLGLETIAEYVEDEKSLAILEDLGANYIQGYIIGKPSNELAK